MRFGHCRGQQRHRDMAQHWWR